MPGGWMQGGWFVNPWFGSREVSGVGIVPGITVSSRFFEGYTLIEMIHAVQQRLGVAPDDYNRYSKANIILALNMAGVRFAKLTNCLLMPALVICRKGQQNYQLPPGGLRIISAQYYTSNNATDYYELEIVRDGKVVQRKDSTYRGTPGIPDYLFCSYRGGAVRKFGVSPIPTIDGTVLSNDTRYGLMATAPNITFAGNITGTHRTGYPSDDDLVDSTGRDLKLLGAAEGFPVFNTTQGTSGIITGFGDENGLNDKIFVVLSGAGVWQPGDTFEIPMSQFGVIVESDGTTTDLISYLGTVNSLNVFGGNITLDVARKPLPFLYAADSTYDLMFSELPSEFQEAQIQWAVYWLAGGQFKGISQPIKAADSLAIFNSYVTEYTAGDHDVEVSNNAIEDRLGSFLD